MRRNIYARDGNHVNVCRIVVDLSEVEDLIGIFLYLISGIQKMENSEISRHHAW